MSKGQNTDNVVIKRDSSNSNSTKSLYVKVTDEEQTEESIELPVETDGTISLSTVAAQFPGASGLKYRNPETGTYRGLRYGIFLFVF